MTELLNSYTFEAKKVVYYSVTVGAENKTEARRIAKDFEHCQHYEDVERFGMLRIQLCLLLFHFHSHLL